MIVGVAVPPSGAIDHKRPRPDRVPSTSGWDTQVAPIATAVERLRGLRFERTVPVDFLSERQFRRRLLPADAPDAETRTLVDQAEDELRATGLVAGDVDLLETSSELEATAVGAFYDSRTRRVTVRGRNLDDATAVTLAHELTHVLQDQHFGLRRLQRKAARSGSEFATLALIEGDANDIMYQYLAELGSSAQRGFTRAAEAGSAGLAGAPETPGGAGEVLSTTFQAPYVLGMSMVMLIRSRGGNRAVDELFRTPRLTDSSFLSPHRLLRSEPVATVPTPMLGPDERAPDEGEPDERGPDEGARDALEPFGAFSLYVMLASRIDLLDALLAADGWNGDAKVAYDRAGTSCVRVSVAGRSAAASARIAAALTEWAALMPPGAATVEAVDPTVTFSSCDPGDAATPPAHPTFAALLFASTRNAAISAALAGGAPTKIAMCIGRELIKDSAFQAFFAGDLEEILAPSRRTQRELQAQALDVTLECEPLD